MKLPNTHEAQNKESYFIKLGELGWSSFFDEQLAGTNDRHSPARVVGVRKNIFLVKKGEEEVQASIAGRLYYDHDMPLPAVGDWVLLHDSVITSVLTRKNVLSRKASGGRARKNQETHLDDQVIAANLDKVFIVCGLDRDFNPRRIERYLTLIYNCGIDPAVILTKADLHLDISEFIREVEGIAFGVSVYPVSANDDDAIDQLRSLITPGQTVALIGSSGAGKSTLINRLCNDDIRSTSSVGFRVGKGKHTTTTRDLITLPSGGMVIDNPGIREIALTIDDQGLFSAFPDIEASARSCRYTDCTHMHEPGCEVLEAVASGRIPEKRLKNYQKMRNELEYHSQLETKGASRVEKERWKGVSQKRKYLKNRRR